MTRLQLIAQAANKIKNENHSQKLKFAGANLTGLFRQAVSISDREYTTSKKDVDTICELIFN